MSHTSILRSDPASSRGPASDVDGALELTLRAASAACGSERGAPFLLLRAARGAQALADGPERSLLLQVVLSCGADVGGTNRARTLPGGCGPVDRDALVTSLIVVAGRLEAVGRLDEAAYAIETARQARGPDERPDLALHAGRIARKRGDRPAARAAYLQVRAAAGEGCALARLASVGEALLEDRPVAALGRVMRAAVRAGESEVAAVALEERARARRGSGDAPGAARDYLVAAARYPDPVDQARVAHALADLLAARGDLPGAREALLMAVDLGRPEQRAHVHARLHDLSRALGDEMGRRRWRPARPAPLVSLLPPRSSAGGSSAAPVVARWRTRVLGP